MKTTAVAWLLGMGIGAGAFALGAYLRDAPPPPSELTTQRDQLAIEVAALTQRLQSLEQRASLLGIEVIDEETKPGLRGTKREGDERSSDDEASAEERPAAWVAGGSPLTWSDDMVDALAKRLEERAWRSIPTPTLLKKARDLLYMKGGGDPYLVTRQLRHLLDRELTEEERTDALMLLGQSTRTTADYAASESTFREPMDKVGGLDTKQGVEAAYQLGWTLQYAGESQRGLHLAEELLNARGLDDVRRPFVRWMEALIASCAGDHARAEAIYTQLIKDYEGDERLKSIVSDARFNLKRMGR